LEPGQNQSAACRLPDAGMPKKKFVTTELKSKGQFCKRKDRLGRSKEIKTEWLHGKLTGEGREERHRKERQAREWSKGIGRNDRHWNGGKTWEEQQARERRKVIGSNDKQGNGGKRNK
jgi:hypothetical protein